MDDNMTAILLKAELRRITDQMRQVKVESLMLRISRVLGHPNAGQMRYSNVEHANTLGKMLLLKDDPYLDLMLFNRAVLHCEKALDDVLQLNLIRFKTSL
jgi:hypothetical protein